MNPDLIKDFGLPIALVIVCAAFFWKGFWPWMTKQVEISQDQTKAARQDARDAVEALSGLKETLVNSNELSRQLVDILRDLKRER